MRQRRVEGGQLDRQRDAHGAAHRAHHAQQALFDRRRPGRGVGGQIVDVELQRVRPRLLEQTGVGQPAAHVAPVERGDDRHRDGRLDAAQLLQILVRAEREVRPGAADTTAPRRYDSAGLVDVRRVRQLFVDQLLLEQRVHDDRRRAGVFELPDGVQVVDQRRCAGHERMR